MRELDSLPKRFEGLVSVIMPCYNAMQHVEHAINSVLLQTYPSWELLIVDDGSKDDSYSVISKFVSKDVLRIHLFRQENCGQWPARNLALRHSKGEFIACLDADDYWREDFLGRMVDPLKRNEADISYCGWQNFGSQAVSRQPYVPPRYEEGDPVREFLTSCPWPIHAAVTRWEIFKSIGGFSERHRRSMDYDFWLRTLGAGARYRLVPEVMAFYRWDGQGQMSDATAAQGLTALEIREMFMSEFPALVAHLPVKAKKELLCKQIRKKAYALYWAGETENARSLFLALMKRRIFFLKDFSYACICFLPEQVMDRLRRLKEKLLRLLKILRHTGRSFLG